VGFQLVRGQIAEADVVAPEAALAQIEQNPLQRQLARPRHLFSALTGDLSNREPPENSSSLRGICPGT